MAALPPGEGGEATAVQPDGTIGAADAEPDREPHEVLGAAPDAPDLVIKRVFRLLVKEGHADQGGSEEYDVSELKQARDELLDDG